MTASSLLKIHACVSTNVAAHILSRVSAYTFAPYDEDFKPFTRVKPGWNFVGCRGVVNDESGHGTHTAGTALGLSSGVAKCATLVGPGYILYHTTSCINTPSTLIYTHDRHSKALIPSAVFSLLPSYDYQTSMNL